MQKFTYKIIGPRAGASAGKTFQEFNEFGTEDFLKMISFDTGYSQSEIEILKIEDATAEEIAEQSTRNKYFERWGTACE